MIRSLPSGARRALAFGLLGVVVAALVAVVAVPLLLLQGYRSELAGVERRIARLAARAPDREQLLAEERALAGESADRLLLRGATPGVAAAQLQGDLTALASALGANVASVQILEPSQVPPYIDVGLRLTMTADIGTLRDFLYTVENRDPVMLVRGFQLSHPETVATAAGADPPPPARSRSRRRSRSTATSPHPRRRPRAGEARGELTKDGGLPSPFLTDRRRPRALGIRRSRRRPRPVGREPGRDSGREGRPR